MKNISKISIFIVLISLVILTSFTIPGNKKSKTRLYRTSVDQSFLLHEELIGTRKKISPIDAEINVEISKTFQEIDGFGYTLTGGSAIHMHNMSDAARNDLLHELFGREESDIGVSYLRLSIGSSDLDEKTWSYDDLAEGETDPDLVRFSLAYDTLYLIPVLKEILKISPDIKILGSPWSPPKWMKDNIDTRGGSLLKEYYNSYSLYFLKYIKSMSDHGITIDAITIQNEPLNPRNNPSLLMLADEQAEFIKNHLGPLFEKNKIKTKIILYDHNADRPDYPLSILSDNAAARYVDGSAFHLYGGKISTLSDVHEAHPSKNLYFTEQWVGAPGNFPVDFSWHIETLVIGATRNWCKNVLEWNLAADENYNPHTDRGGCDRCLGAVTITGDKVTRNPAYYIIAQASKFVPPGSVRIDSNLPENIPNVAFITPAGKIVVILQNKNKESQNIRLTAGKKHIEFLMNPGDVATIVM